MNADAWQKVALGIVMRNDEGDEVNVDDGTVNELWHDALRHASGEAWWAEGHQAGWSFDPPCPIAYGDDFERWLDAMDLWARRIVAKVKYRRVTALERQILTTTGWYVACERGRPEVAVWPPNVMDGLSEPTVKEVAR